MTRFTKPAAHVTLILRCACGVSHEVDSKQELDAALIPAATHLAAVKSRQWFTEHAKTCAAEYRTRHRNQIRTSIDNPGSGAPPPRVSFT